MITQIFVVRGYEMTQRKTEPFDIGRVQDIICSLETIRCSDDPVADAMLLRAIRLASKSADTLPERYDRAVAVSRALFPVLAHYESLKQWTLLGQVKLIAKDISSVAAQLQLQLDIWAEVGRIRKET